MIKKKYVLPWLLLMSVGANAITFSDVTEDAVEGEQYSYPSFIAEPSGGDPMSFEEIIQTPSSDPGMPGVAVFDYDRDGDLDIYVSNRLGKANSLYENTLNDGQVTFIDVAIQAGVEASDQDSSGVCFGDIDNDGDHDLLVLGSGSPHKLFENIGNGSFIDIAYSGDFNAEILNASSCSMGDINNDGLLDIVIVNAINEDHAALAIYAVPFELNYSNQLFLNLGENSFQDISEESGILTHAGLGEENADKPTITWAVSMVDYDLDGDMDIITADDQAFLPSASGGGTDRGILHIFNNDGSGHFTDMTVQAGTNIIGGWMGLSFGDLNCDSHMDFFGSNAGGQVFSLATGISPPLVDLSSRWFLGQNNNTFNNPGVGSLIDTPFGWGTSMQDFDNDGDADIVFYGGLRATPQIIATNPGVMLFNENCSADFVFSSETLNGRHTSRNVHALATGDLNDDGFMDIVSVSNFNIPSSVPLIPTGFDVGSPFDAFANSVPLITPANDDATLFTHTGFEFAEGTLSIELNSADNANKWAKIALLGGKGITPEASVNRDAIGSVVQFTPKHGKPSMKPVLGGASHVSQNSLTLTFGLGRKNKGVVDILWPGGVKNRLYNVRKSERIEFPEIPCSITSDIKRKKYKRCVREALNDYLDAGVIPSKRMYKRFYRSAMKAYNEIRWERWIEKYYASY